ncbi:juvenile hormone esterase-like [Cylas formicarius]|uniref:juvenile hormone esterase-like n=1 Tax=Cylas formicarius TaxID=197179 RepID=UPI0029589FB2|nr:juvenile hormone esterase-like [Cylas formicarius]
MYHSLPIIALFAAAVNAGLLIDLPHGTIQGSEIKNENHTYYAYRGIPFALPPLGNLRFQAPIPNEPWNGVLNATEMKSCCVQMDSVGNPDRFSEDCLHINVYTPARNISEKLPVMLWIYGGGFLFGCASDIIFGPYPLVDEDVIVVTFNYRLGVLGFLSTEDKVVLGNAALKDQLLAMKWTQKNIEYFGGDPEKVTLFGQSAGGISVGAHIVNKKSAGLYRAAICQSGCSLTNLAQLTQPNPRKAAYDIARSVNPSISEENTTDEVVDFLQSLPVDVLVDAFKTNPIVGPIVEIEDENAYVTDLSFGLLESGNFNQVPCIIGTTSAESLGMVGSTLVLLLTSAATFDSGTTVVPSNLKPLPLTNLDEVASLIKKSYTGGLPFLTNLTGFVEYGSDLAFVKSSLKQAEVQSSYSPVYFYQFSYSGSISKVLHIEVEGAGNVGHTEDLYYLFNVMDFQLTSQEELLTRSRMKKLWTNFAKSLNPTPDPSDPLLNVTWPQVSGTNIPYLDIDKILEVKPGKKKVEMAMWDYVYYTYGEQPFVGF